MASKSICIFFCIVSAALGYERLRKCMLIYYVTIEFSTISMLSSCFRNVQCGFIQNYCLWNIFWGNDVPTISLCSFKWAQWSWRFCWRL